MGNGEGGGGNFRAKSFVPAEVRENEGLNEVTERRGQRGDSFVDMLNGIL